MAAEEPVNITGTVVITGASSGIGAALAVALAEDGHQVYVCGRRHERIAGLSARSPRIHGRACDVANEADVQQFAAWVQETAGTVDTLINCAGGFGAIGPMWETDPVEWTATIQANLVGTYLVTRAMLPLMFGTPRPRVINFSGGGAFGPFPRYTAYAVSKAAIVRLTETLAEELAPRGVLVNAVAPGFVATEIHDATLAAGDRAGDNHLTRTRQLLTEDAVPMDIPVDCVRFLISPAADGLTGKTISASFDPWRSEDFRLQIPAISASDLYTQRRVNLVHLPDGDLKRVLTAATDHARGTT